MILTIMGCMHILDVPLGPIESLSLAVVIGVSVRRYMPLHAVIGVSVRHDPTRSDRHPDRHPDLYPDPDRDADPDPNPHTEPQPWSLPSPSPSSSPALAQALSPLQPTPAPFPRDPSPRRRRPTRASSRRILAELPRPSGWPSGPLGQAALLCSPRICRPVTCRYRGICRPV